MIFNGGIVKERSKIADKYKWDLSTYYKNMSDWEKGIKELITLSDVLLKYKDKLNNTDTFLDFLQEELKYDLLLEKLNIYIYLRECENIADNKVQEKMNYFYNIESQLTKKLSFVGEEVADFKKSYYNKLLKDDRFKVYKRNFKNKIRLFDHKLSKDEVRVINKLNNSFENSSSIFNILDNVSIKFEDAKDKKGKLQNLAIQVYQNMLKSKMLF